VFSCAVFDKLTTTRYEFERYCGWAWPADGNAVFVLGSPASSAAAATELCGGCWSCHAFWVSTAGPLVRWPHCPRMLHVLVLRRCLRTGRFHSCRSVLLVNFMCILVKAEFHYLDFMKICRAQQFEDKCLQCGLTAESFFMHSMTWHDNLSSGMNAVEFGFDVAKLRCMQCLWLPTVGWNCITRNQA